MKDECTSKDFFFFFLNNRSKDINAIRDNKCFLHFILSLYES